MKRLKTICCVEAGGAIGECFRTGGSVFAAGCEGIERSKTNGRIIHTSGEVKQGITTLGCVLVFIAAVRWRFNGLRSL